MPSTTVAAPQSVSDSTGSDPSHLTAAVSASRYYQTWSGHPVDDLHRVLHQLRALHYRRLVWLAGDSSLDNKAWVQAAGLSEQAAPAFNTILSPAKSAPDVCHWMNVELDSAGLTDTACIMTAVEASTLSERLDGSLRPQDTFIRQHIGEDDALIVSVGGNDIALSPSTATMTNMGLLLMTPFQCLSPAAGRTLLRHHPSFQYFVRLFRDGVTAYIKQLTSIKMPRTILVCMIYYPCEEITSSSWSDRLLSTTGYNSNPRRLQFLIKLIFEEATSSICIDGSQVVPVALFDILSADNSDLYVARVEPSSLGGHLMAQRFVQLLGATRDTVEQNAAAGVSSG